MSRAKVRKDGVQRDAVTAGIFWLVPQVTLRKRLDLIRDMERWVPRAHLRVHGPAALTMKGLGEPHPDRVRYPACCRDGVEGQIMAFHEVRFPNDISRGARGGPRRRTQVVTLDSGKEERNASWADSRRVYDAVYGVRQAMISPR